MARDTFTLLLESSNAFNRFLIIQLNERLGQFIAMVEHDRLSTTRNAPEPNHGNR
jgi:CRP/FNR family transcriptional regulator, cyclic AMP receptor protein